MSDGKIEVFNDEHQFKLRHEVELLVKLAVDEVKNRAFAYMFNVREAAQKSVGAVERSALANISHFEMMVRQAVVNELHGDRMERAVMLHALVMRGVDPSEAANTVAAVDNARGYKAEG